MPGQLLTVPYTAVQFVALQQCRAMARQYGMADSPRWQSAVPFVSGALAGAAATVASYPFDLLRTTLAAQGEPPVYATMTDAGEGAGGAVECAWRFGLALVCAAEGPNECHPFLLHRMHRCLPLTAKQAPILPPTPAARGIVRQHGVRGLYRGLGVTVLEIMPYAALQFGLYDVFNKAFTTARVREGRTWVWDVACRHAVAIVPRCRCRPPHPRCPTASHTPHPAGAARPVARGRAPLQPAGLHVRAGCRHAGQAGHAPAGCGQEAVPGVLRRACGWLRNADACMPSS